MRLLTTDHVEEPTNEELRLFTRRNALSLLGMGGLGLIAGCSSQTATPITAAATVPAASSSRSADAAIVTTITDTLGTEFGSSGSCILIPEETAGPYPLDLSGSEAFFRSDITEGKQGLPLTLEMVVVDANNDCAPIEGARVDV